MQKLLIQKINPNMPDPKFSSEHAGGIDFYPDIEETIVLEPGEKASISTGIKMAIPVGYVGLLMPRSSTGNNGLMLKNTIGLIDSDYRGLVTAKIRNTEDLDLVINPTDRFVQMTIVKIYEDGAEIVDSLPETERGEGGFGSTGK